MEKNEREQLIKDIVFGSAKLSCVLSGGVAVYNLVAKSGRKYQLEINLSDKHDVGETATFEVEYKRASTLMRWVRRAVEKNTLVDLNPQH